jgi:hypothetical protein
MEVEETWMTLWLLSMRNLEQVEMQKDSLLLRLVNSDQREALFVSLSDFFFFSYKKLAAVDMVALGWDKA